MSEDREQVERILHAGQTLTTVEGVVSRAVVVLEVQQADGSIAFDLHMTSPAPWDNVGLLDYARAQVLLAATD